MYHQLTYLYLQYTLENKKIERLTKCPLCKSGLFLNHTEITDFAVSKESFILCKCTKCQLVFTNPRPTETAIQPYYDFPEYYSHNNEGKSLTSVIYGQVRNLAISKKYKLVESLNTEKSILDIGCGTGDFLKYVQDKGWTVKGLEPNKKARTQASEKLGVKVLKSLEKLDEKQKFGVITLFHVLEHIHELKKGLKYIINSLLSNGYIIIAVPNHESKDAEKYGKYWAGWDVPRHLYHFNDSSIEYLAEKYDLEIIDKKPMVFDSYYVSLLSEKYQNPEASVISNYSKSVIAGFKSNRAASKSGNYSSNLYILRKK